MKATEYSRVYSYGFWNGVQNGCKICSTRPQFAKNEIERARESAERIYEDIKKMKIQGLKELGI
jgi:biotin synthase-like enzyme